MYMYMYLSLSLSVGRVLVEGRVVAGDDRGVGPEQAAEVQLEERREGLLPGEVARGPEDDDGAVALLVQLHLHHRDVAVLQHVVQRREGRRLGDLLPPAPGRLQHEGPVWPYVDPGGLQHLLALHPPLRVPLALEGFLDALVRLRHALVHEDHDVVRLADHPEVDGDAVPHLVDLRLGAEHADLLVDRLRPALGVPAVPLGGTTRLTLLV